MGEADGIPKVNWPWTSLTFALTVRTEPQVTKGRARPPPAAAKSLTAPAIFSLAPFGGRTKKKELLWPVFLTGPFHSIPFHCYIAKYNFPYCISGSKIPLPSLYGVKTIPWGSAHSDHHCAGRSERWKLQKCTWCSIQHVQGLVKLELFSKFYSSSWPLGIRSRSKRGCLLSVVPSAWSRIWTLLERFRMTFTESGKSQIHVDNFSK